MLLQRDNHIVKCVCFVYYRISDVLWSYAGSVRVLASYMAKLKILGEKEGDVFLLSTACSVAIVQ